jgi:anti-sigma B factor antagonist
MDAMVFSVFSSDVGVGNRASAPLVSRDGDRTVVWLDGEHDFATVYVLTDMLARAISVDDADLIIDLSGVTFIGSAAIDELIRGRNILHRQARSLTLRSPSRCAKRVLDVCGLTGLVEGT